MISTFKSPQDSSNIFSFLGLTATRSYDFKAVLGF